jgi:Holliday junction resolvase RusA-like endonuclease
MEIIMATVYIWVPGIPVPGGSKRAFAHSSTGRIIVTDMSGKRGHDWRSCVADQAAIEMRRHGFEPFTGPLEVSFAFILPRPKGHYGTGKNAGVVKHKAPTHHTTKPDTTKLVRSAVDAMTGIVWRDDAQIAIQFASKMYGQSIGLSVGVKELDTYGSEA